MGLFLHTRGLTSGDVASTTGITNHLCVCMCVFAKRELSDVKRGLLLRLGMSADDVIIHVCVCVCISK